MIILNWHILNNFVLKLLIQKLTELQKARNVHHHSGRFLNTLLSVTDRSQAGRKISKERRYKQQNEQADLMVIHRPTDEDYVFFLTHT